MTKYKSGKNKEKKTVSEQFVIVYATAPFGLSLNFILYKIFIYATVEEFIMKNILLESESIMLRVTEVTDLDFVINEEYKEENSKYVYKWTKEQHIKAMQNDDVLQSSSHTPVGYLILAGLENTNNNIEFMRIVISKKGSGYGRETLKLVKELSFNKLNAHRLWLDVKGHNINAQNLYKSEGFTQEGILRDCLYTNGVYESLVIMSILHQEYINK